MPGPDDAARYHRLQLYLGLAGFALPAVYFLAVLASGASARLAHVASAQTWAWWVQVALVAAALELGQAIVGFPLRVVRGFWLPRRFGLLHQPFTGWLADGAKAAALVGLLGLGGVLGGFGPPRRTPWGGLIVRRRIIVVC